MIFVVGFGAFLVSFILVCLLVQSGRLKIRPIHLLIARVTIAGLILPPFGAFTFSTLIFLPPLVVVVLAFPVSSLLFRDWLGKYPEFQTALTFVNILMLLGIIAVDVATFFEGKIIPDISLH